MKESIALIKYDFFGITMKNITKYLAAYVILLLVSIIVLPETILIAIMLLPPSILETVVTQSKRYSQRIYGILPMRRCTLANARYLLSVVILFGTLLASVIVFWISKVAGIYTHITVFSNIASFIDDYSIQLISLAFLMSCIYSAIILFSNLVFTGAKAEISTILILVVCFVISVCILLMTHVTTDTVKQMGADTMTQFGFLISSVLIGLLFMAVSYIASRRLLEKIDLSR